MTVVRVRLLWREINIVPTFGWRATRDRSIRAIRVGVTRQVRAISRPIAGPVWPGRAALATRWGRCGGVLGTVNKGAAGAPARPPTTTGGIKNHRLTQAPVVQRHPTRGDR
jgi:hypothetical protein